jgi:hypothetical protein
MQIKTITPIEFDRDGYRQQWKDGKIVVLLNKDGWLMERADMILKSSHGESYDIYTIDSGDYRFGLRPYEHGLIIISEPDYDELRRQLVELVLKMPDSEVIYELCQNDWKPIEEGERNDGW